MSSEGIYFTHDGSVNSDWVSHYAIRLAARHAARSLHLIHIRDGETHEADFRQKVSQIQTECDRLGVRLDIHNKPLKGSISQSIQHLVPPGWDSYLVCGLRVRERRRGLLSGTVSEQLLRSGHCNVLALRVVHPGLLGLPRRLLLPVSGHPRGMRLGLPFLRLFGPDISHLRLLFVQLVSSWRFRMLSHQATEQRRGPGMAYCDRIEREVADQLQLGANVLDSTVVVSDDVPKEIVIAANKSKSRLIYLGASERTLPAQFLHGNPVEQVLRNASCDVAVYRGVE